LSRVPFFPLRSRVAYLLWTSGVPSPIPPGTHYGHPKHVQGTFRRGVDPDTIPSPSLPVHADPPPVQMYFLRSPLDKCCSFFFQFSLTLPTKGQAPLFCRADAPSTSQAPVVCLARPLLPSRSWQQATQVLLVIHLWNIPECFVASLQPPDGRVPLRRPPSHKVLFALSFLDRPSALRPT